MGNVSSYRGQISRNSSVAGNNEVVSLTKGKRGPKKKLLSTDNRLKRAKPLSRGSVAAKVARKSNSASSQPRYVLFFVNRSFGLAMLIILPMASPFVKFCHYIV